MGFPRRFVIFILCCLMLVTTVSAANGVSSSENMTTVYQDGSCQVRLTVTIHLDTAVNELRFPLPRAARDVTMNGTSVNTYKISQNPDVVFVNLDHLTGAMGDYTMTFYYTLPSVVDLVEEEDAEDKLMLNVPLISGFDYPVSGLTFSVTLPADVTGTPKFYSGYYLQSIESSIDSVVSGPIISGVLKQALKDRETLTLSMEVPKEMFPQKVITTREGNPEIIPMAICAGLALVYWLIFMRSAPVFRQRRTLPPEGVTAGELGCRLTMVGADLTMMVFTWAQLGYIRIRPDRRGKVYLQKRMDMGNERSAFEIKVFNTLFGKNWTVDGTGTHYARLWKKVNASVPGTKEMYRRKSGSRKLFRILAALVSAFCGICLAMNMTTMAVLQVMLAIALVILGIFTAWKIQEGICYIHLRGKSRLVTGLVCCLVWLYLGYAAGVFVIGLCAVLAQVLAGFAMAYGGRRTELGKLNASYILGLRQYLKTVPNGDLYDLMHRNPDYFFEMMPYAMALGVDKAFAKQFGKIHQPQCTYMDMGRAVKRSTLEWAGILVRTAEKLDARHKRMDREKWMVVTISRRR